MRSAVSVESRFADRTAVIARGSRSYFLVPWRGHTLLGTADILHRGSAENYRLTKEEVATFVDEARSVYRNELIRPENVRYAFGGLRPIEPEVKAKLASSSDGHYGSVEAAHRDVFRDDADAGNIISVEGIKYTTARLVAEQTLDRVLPRLGRAGGASASARTVLRGGEGGSAEAVFARRGAELSRYTGEALARELCGDYGAQVEQLLELATREPELGRVLGGRVLAAQVAYAVRAELARTLADVAFRRTGLATAGLPERETLVAVAAVMGRELGWSEERCRSEVDAVAGCPVQGEG